MALLPPLALLIIFFFFRGTRFFLNDNEEGLDATFNQSTACGQVGKATANDDARRDLERGSVNLWETLKERRATWIQKWFKISVGTSRKLYIYNSFSRSRRGRWAWLQYCIEICVKHPRDPT
jgi:hypothetical protein